MQNLSLTELQPLILEWAKERNILFPENAPKQRLKLIEECGELASAILKNDVKLKKDAIGDIFVVLTILSEQIGFQLVFSQFTVGSEIPNDEVIANLIDNAISVDYANIFNSVDWLYEASINLKLNLTECANIAWNEIKDRTGKTVNGTFIKD